MSIANLPLKGRFRLGTSLRVQSALPYNITTGRDDNGDTVSNDRPAGVTRNTGRGSAQVDLGLRVCWSIGVRRRRRRRRRAAGSHRARRQRRSAGRHAGGVDGQKRYSVELYAQAYNVLNHMNAAELQRRAGVAVLRAGDVGGGAAASRDRDAVFVLIRRP